MSENLGHSITGRDNGELNINGIATYQPFDGTMELKLVNSNLSYSLTFLLLLLNV